MPEHYDVIVAGAGPAGVTAALYARRRGARVLLVDKRRFPRDKICGDGIAGRCIGYLNDLGVLDNVRARCHEPIGAAILGAPSGALARFDLNPRGSSVDPYLICRREVLDDILVRAARAEVDVLEGWAVDDVLVTAEGSAAGVRCTGPDGEVRQYTGRAIVGADGFHSVVARRLGAYHYDTHRWLVATRQYFRNLDIPPRTAQIHFLDETLPGYFWMFPTGGGVVNVGLGSVHHTVKRRGGIRRMHERVLASDRFGDLFARAAAVSDVHGWNLPTPDRKRVICGAGFVLVGDAAGTVDPFTGEGLGNAMCSGEVAARVITRALDRSEAGSLDLDGYAALLWKELDAREFALHYRLRALARSRRLLDFVVGRAARHEKTLDWLARMIFESDASERQRSLLAPLTYVKLLFSRPG